ncbi:MAG: CsbD family protein [Pseudomonas sp.]|uniref:CsbD family protein n=1 Tax=unclassified Pseudomonas TaxID=196821 RepID=UPI001CFA4DDA|nr:CsbD family protein [Pseudomonas sp. L5B5]UCZ85917.1 CsbD family protein [Pseudomonas sp. L5B5]
MASEQLKGKVDKAAGKAQAMVGELLDDDSMQARGVAREAAGQLQEHYSQVLDRGLRWAREKPLASVALLAGVGLLAGLLLRRR